MTPIQRAFFNVSVEAQRSGTSSASVAHQWIMATTIGFVLWFYAWTALTTTTADLRLNGRQSDYYNLLVDGFLNGELSLSVRPSADLLAAKNPYDPLERPPGSALHDASLFEGRYYLYFGVAPVVTLFLPFRLVTGHDLPLVYGNIAFAWVGYLAAAALFLLIRRRYFPTTSLTVTVFLLLALGLTNTIWTVLRRPSFWELPISAGYAFTTSAMLAAFIGLHVRRAEGWFLAAGVALGLAVGSRPTFIVLAPVLLLWILARGWLAFGGSRQFLRRGGWWRETALLGGSFAAIIACLLLYNDARFGDPFEFGLNYQLTNAVEAEKEHFSPRYLPFNLSTYFFAAGEWGRYFPFLHPTSVPTPPPGHSGVEQVFGLLPTLPIVVLAGFAPLVWSRGTGKRAPLRWFVASLATAVLGVTIIIGGFVMAVARYATDIAPLLVLLATVGGLVLFDVVQNRRWLRMGTLWVIGVLTAYSAFAGFVAGVQLYDGLRDQNPRLYARIARVLDWPTHVWEKATGYEPGALELELVFPETPQSSIEPLLSTGWFGASDRVTVEYPEPGWIRFGYWQAGRHEASSAATRIEPGALTHVRLDLGSLYPPEHHPFFDRFADLERQAIRRTLLIEVNGEPVWERVQAFFDSSPAVVRVGEAAPEEGEFARFSGDIVAVRKVSRSPRLQPLPRQPGPVRFRAILPTAPLTGSEPLVATGEPGAGEVLMVHYVTEGMIQLGYDRWGQPLRLSEPIALDPRRAHEWEVHLPSWLPSEATDAVQRRHLRVLIDGVVEWGEYVGPHEASRATIAVGRNSVGSTACGPRFSGVLLELAAAPTPPPLPSGVTGPVSYRLRLPRGQRGQTEPLLSLGRPGAADVLSVRYPDDDHVEFLLDHWGHGAVSSGLVRVDYTAVHEVSIHLASLEPARSAAGRGTSLPGRARVDLNGQTVWETITELYTCDLHELAYLANPVGASTANPAFTGSVIEVSRRENAQ